MQEIITIIHRAAAAHHEPLVGFAAHQLVVLECAPEEALVAYATWAGDFHPERYPSVRETWGWLNRQWGELRP